MLKQKGKEMLTEKSYIGVGNVPIGIGAVLRGWNITDYEFRRGSSVVDFRAMTEECPHNCFHCFAKNQRTLGVQQIKAVIDGVAKTHARGINFIGEGEPTIDPDFFAIIEHAAYRGVTPVVFTDGATRMVNRDFVAGVKNACATVCVKCDSLFNPEYQNWVVGDNKQIYCGERNKALRRLVDAGFNEKNRDGTTRLGINMTVTTKNIDEVDATLRYCRKRNIFVMFSSFLPVGKFVGDNFDFRLQLSVEERKKMHDLICLIDKEEFGFEHRAWSSYVTTPCVERLQIFGDGRVSPCPGNEEIIGTVQECSIPELEQVLINRFPCHNHFCFNGNCLYRQAV